jgi:hypothetical protein
MNAFYDFLKSKKIDPQSFEKGDHLRFEEFRKLFEEIHPNSLIAQKLFLINSIRKKYPHIDSVGASDTSKKKTMLKPKITPKPNSK